jgi:hypothetical protein
MKTDPISYLGFLEENLASLSSECQPLWHPLGFSSCVIKSDIPGQVLRVHFWPPGERRTKNPDWPIHTHSYKLSSLVLQGTIHDIQYKRYEGDDFVVYEVTYDNGNSKISQSGRHISISESTNLIQEAGCQYTVLREVFHQSRVSFDSSAVTLVSLSDMTADTPLVLGINGDDSYPYERKLFPKDRFWDAVKTAIDTFPC